MAKIINLLIFIALMAIPATAASSRQDGAGASRGPDWDGGSADRQQDGADGEDWQVDGITAATAAPGPSVPDDGVTHRGCECGSASGAPGPLAVLFLGLLLLRRRARGPILGA